MNGPTPLVSAQWLRDHLGTPGLVVIDASFHLPNSGRDPAAEYLAARIPGARRFDADRVADHDTNLPHMLPAAGAFAEAMQALGISDDDFVVAYDSEPGLGAARAWWMLRSFGHDGVSVLDGGFHAWKAQAGALESGTPLPVMPGTFSADARADLVVDETAVAEAAQAHQPLIVDARGAARFRGEVAEPRPGLRSGHIPSSRNVPYAELLDARGKFKPADDLRRIFSTGGVDPNAALITTCGSGISACTLALGLAVIGNNQVAVYDGSWAEWGADQQRPVETGSAR